MAPKIKELPSVFVLEDFRLVPRRCFLSDLSWLVFGIGWDVVHGHSGQLSPLMLFRHVRCALCPQEDGEAVPENHPHLAEDGQQGPVPHPPLRHGARGGQKGSQALGATAVLWCGTAAPGAQMW